MAATALKPAPSRSPRSWSRALTLLVAALVLVLGLAEAGARLAIEPLSKIEARISAEARAAAAQRGGVLAVGNSLLLEGVDFPKLRDGLAPEFDARRYIVEDTGFLDWRYGLRRLYAEGARPGVLVVSLNLPQMLSERVRGEYSAYRLMTAGDTWSAARDASMGHTEACSLFFGHVSAFYGLRVEIRKALLLNLMPGMQGLASYLRPPARRPRRDRAEAVGIVAGRMREVEALVRGQGGRAVFVVPAALAVHEPEWLEEAGRQAGAAVLVPLQPSALSAADFFDGLHLNAAGRARYTSALTPLLRQELGR